MSRLPLLVTKAGWAGGMMFSPAPPHPLSYLPQLTVRPRAWPLRTEMPGSCDFWILADFGQSRAGGRGGQVPLLLSGALPSYTSSSRRVHKALPPPPRPGCAVTPQGAGQPLSFPPRCARLRPCISPPHLSSAPCLRASSGDPSSAPPLSWRPEGKPRRLRSLRRASAYP